MTDRFKKGHVFAGPGGMGYRLTRDVSVGEVVTPDQFQPIGDAPHPDFGAMLPKWLVSQIWPETFIDG